MTIFENFYDAYRVVLSNEKCLLTHAICTQHIALVLFTSVMNLKLIVNHAHFGVVLKGMLGSYGSKSKEKSVTTLNFTDLCFNRFTGKQAAEVIPGPISPKLSSIRHTGH